MLTENTIDLTDIEPVKKLFHNEKIDVYESFLAIDEILFWPENARNILDFDTLIYNKSVGNKTKVKLQDIPEEEILEYLIKQPKMKLGTLKSSIKENGIQIPLIITEDRKLLDGNRRYFASKFLQQDMKHKWNELEQLTKIPVYLVKNKDLDANPKIQRKILAEANFVKDLREPWTPDVKAKMVSEYYFELIAQGYEIPAAFAEIKDVYSVAKSTASDYIKAKQLADEFWEAGDGEQEQLERKRLVEKQFVYFWEFYSKSSKGNTKLDLDDQAGAKKLFFSMVKNNRIKSVDNVRVLIRVKKVNYLWDKLVASSGLDIDGVEILEKEHRSSKVAADKIAAFTNFIEHKFGSDKKPNDNETKLMTDLSKLLEMILGGQK